MKHPEKVMVWCVFLLPARVLSTLYHNIQTVNAQRYIGILEAKLQPAIDIHRTGTF